MKPNPEILSKIKNYIGSKTKLDETATSISKKLFLDQATVRKYLNYLKIEFKTLTTNKKNKPISVEIDGVTYPSILAASKATGIHPNTLNYRFSPSQRQRAKERYEKDKQKAFKTSYLGTTKTWESKLLDGMRRRISNNKKYTNLSCTVTIEDIKKLFNQVSDRCEICNQPYNFEIANDIDLRQPSIDRINSNTGYVPDNIRIVCFQCNTNHRSDLFTKRCSNCSSWVLSHGNHCHMCGFSIEKQKFDDNWETWLSIRDRVINGSETLSLERQKHLFNELCKKTVSRNKGNLIPSYRTGLLLADSFFPNRLKAYKTNERSFHSWCTDDNKMKEVIKVMTEENATVRPGLILDYVRKVSNYKVARVYNFRPIVAREVINKYAPNNGAIYDFSSGFGGRLLGACATNKNLDYIGVDPNTETYKNLQNLKNFLKKEINYSGNIEIYKACSEEFLPDKYKNKIDLAISSPPYYDLEQYSEELTQSYRRYPSYSLWREKFLKQTLSNIHQLLKNDGILAINVKNTNYDIADDTKLFATELGFSLIDTLEMELSSRTSSSRTEPILIFKKSG